MATGSLRASAVLPAFFGLTLPLMPVQARAAQSFRQSGAPLSALVPPAGVPHPRHHARRSRVPSLTMRRCCLSAIIHPGSIFPFFRRWRRFRSLPNWRSAAGHSFRRLARLQRSVFVDRTRRLATGDAANAITARLERGDTDRSCSRKAHPATAIGCLPFKTSLFGAVAGADGATGGSRVVQTAAVVYTHIHGIPVTRADRPRIGWYGDMEMTSHAWGVLKSGADYRDHQGRAAGAVKRISATGKTWRSRANGPYAATSLASCGGGRDADLVPVEPSDDAPPRQTRVAASTKARNGHDRRLLCYARRLERQRINPFCGRFDDVDRSDPQNLYLKTFGCQMNVYDSERMAEALAREGYRETAELDAADLVILNTCHIREKAAEKVYSDLGRIRDIKDARGRHGKSTVIAVAGCVAQAEGAEITARQPAVDLVIGPQSYHRLPELITRTTDERKQHRRDGISGRREVRAHECARRVSSPSAFLTVQEGCDKFCSFCVVPYTRGAEFSRPVAKIEAEARELAERGARGNRSARPERQRLSRRRRGRADGEPCGPDPRACAASMGSSASAT